MAASAVERHEGASTEELRGELRRAIEAWRSFADEGVVPEAPVALMGFERGELRQLFAQGLGEKGFRGEQLFNWLHGRLEDDFEQMSSLAKSLRQRLPEIATTRTIHHQGSFPSDDGTTKLTFRCEVDNAVIESVFIPSRERNTLCISSQVGCAMGCTFCYTAKMGLRRNLSAAEIVEQVVWARGLMSEEEWGHLGNIVFMGMGEPLHNLDNVIRAIRILTDDKGLNFSWRKITVSTSGLVPQLKQLRQEVDVRLAISLNASTDEIRSKIMPINDRWDLEALMGCLRELPLKNNERITFEYVLLAGINDSLADAQRIIELTEGIPRKINLIPFNPHPDTPFETPAEVRIDKFQRYLAERHITCMRRKTRGREAMAACGQLGKPGDKKAPKHLRDRLERLRQEGDGGEGS